MEAQGNTNIKGPAQKEEQKEAKKSTHLNDNAAPFVPKSRKTAPPEKKSEEISAPPKPLSKNATEFVPKKKPTTGEAPAPLAGYTAPPPREEFYYPYQSEMGYEHNHAEFGHYENDSNSEGGIEDMLDEFVKECENCPCCKGFVYNCSGEACKNLGRCYCKVTQEIENSQGNKQEENKV